VCGNDFLVPIPFPLPSNHSHSHSNTAFPFPCFPITSIPIPTHFGQRLYIDYLKAEFVVNSKQNMKLQQKHCNQSHHSSVVIIIIITIIANHCSLFTVQRLWEFYFSPIKYAVPTPIRTIPIPISSPKLLPFPWESHGNGNSHSHAHLYSEAPGFVFSGNDKPVVQLQTAAHTTKMAVGKVTVLTVLHQLQSVEFSNLLHRGDEILGPLRDAIHKFLPVALSIQSWRPGSI